MMLAAKTTIEKITNEAVYGNAAQVNKAVAAKSAGRVPCYAINGKRVAFKWVSIGSSCTIGRAEATSMLARVGVNISEAEAA